MKNLKKNISSNKGGKNASVNSKLTEDMVFSYLFSKTKSRTPSLFMILPTQDLSIAKISEAFSETSPIPKWTANKLKTKSQVLTKTKILSAYLRSSIWSPKNGSSVEAEKSRLWTCLLCLIEKNEVWLVSTKLKLCLINISISTSAITISLSSLRRQILTRMAFWTNRSFSLNWAINDHRNHI